MSTQIASRLHFIPQVEVEAVAAQQAEQHEQRRQAAEASPIAKVRLTAYLHRPFAVEWSPVSLVDLFEDESLVVLLIDQSGSATPSFQSYVQLAAHVARDAMAAGKRAAVYGYSAGGGYSIAYEDRRLLAGEDLLLVEYKGPDSRSLAGIAALPLYGGGGTPTIEALEELSRRYGPYEPTQGALFITLTDGAAFDSSRSPRGPGVVRDLRQSGYKIVALGDDMGFGGAEPDPQLARMFDPDFAAVNPRRLDQTLERLQTLLAEIGLPRAERTASPVILHVNVALDRSGYTDQLLPNPYLDKEATEVEIDAYRNALLANGVYEVRGEEVRGKEGSVVRALFREGQWFHEPQPRPFDGKPVFPVPVDDAQVIAVLDTERVQYLGRPELSMEAPTTVPPTLDADGPMTSL
jgi:hypothetical protein